MGQPEVATQPGRVNLMIRNVPSRATVQELVAAIDDAGFTGRYEYLNMPTKPRSGQNKGHAFIGFRDDAEAAEFGQRLSGKHIRSRRSPKVLSVIPAASMPSFPGSRHGTTSSSFAAIPVPGATDPATETEPTRPTGAEGWPPRTSGGSAARASAPSAEPLREPCRGRQGPSPRALPLREPCRTGCEDDIAIAAVHTSLRLPPVIPSLPPFQFSATLFWEDARASGHTSLPQEAAALTAATMATPVMVGLVA